MLQQKKIIEIVFKDDWFASILLCIFELIKGFFPLIYVLSYAVFIDAMVEMFYHPEVKNLPTSAIVMVLVLTSFQYFSGSLLTYFNERCKLSVETLENEKLLQKIGKIKFQKMEDAETYETIIHVQKGIPDKIFNGFKSLVSFFSLMISILSIVVIISKYSIILCIVVLICFIPVVLISIKGGKDDYSILEEYYSLARKTDCYEEMLCGEKQIGERKIYNYFQWGLGRWQDLFDQTSKVFMKYKRCSYSRIKGMSFLIKLILWGVVGIIIYLSVNNTLTIGVAAILIQQILSLSSRVTWELYSDLYDVTVASQYMRKYTECYSIEEEMRGLYKICDAKKIECINLSYRYSDASPYILKKLNLTLFKGQTYALVGENGAGKTTLIKILLGFYDDYEGKILVDGIELREINQKSDLISSVFQRFAQYEISIRENLGLRHYQQLSDIEIHNMTEMLQLNIEDAIEYEGYDTFIGKLKSGGIELSGGQWQKIAMMRAIIQKRNWMILDEPTSALDPIAEAELYSMFATIMKEKTCILVTHRLGAAKLAHKILLLANGMISEEGTHEELILFNGVYAMMYKKQKGWYMNEENKTDFTFGE